MNIFLTGASGMLAAEVTPKLISLGHGVIQTDVRPRMEGIIALDIADEKRVFEKISMAKPDYVFHLAAETNVDLCEQKPDHAFRINTLGTENIVLACQKFDIPLLYVSTSSVFPGVKKEPYTEFDAPNPVNVYAKSKLGGEIVVQKLLQRYFIVRAGWMVGGWDIDKKFVYKIVQQLKEGKKELRVVSDKFGSPTFTKDFANHLMNIVNTGRYGIYHLTNKGSCSRYDMAVKIVEFMGLKGQVKIQPISSDEFPLPAPRADSEMVRNYKLDLLGFNNMPEWQESLEYYIKTNKNSA